MKLHEKAGGFALIEVVIAMFVLAIGILGAGALQTVGMQTTQAAFYRSQAMLLAGDVLNRMRANRAVASSYVGNTETADATACIRNDEGCSPAALALDDMREWSDRVKKSGIPNAAGTITSPATNRYIIEISWDENDWQSGKYERTASTKTYQLNVALDNH